MESPHPQQSLWSTVQSNIRANVDVFPPTPASMSLASCSTSGTKSADDRTLLWSSQGIAEEAGLYSATSQVMRMGAAPLLLEGDYLLSSVGRKGGKARKTALPSAGSSGGIGSGSGSGSKSGIKRGGDAVDFSKLEDSNDSCNLHFASEGPASVSKATQSSRKKKTFTPESDAQTVKGAILGTSPPDGNSSSVEKLSVAVKSQKIGTTSVQKGGSVAQSATQKRLIKAHSLLENFDLSRCIGGRQTEEATGEDSNNSTSREATAMPVSLATQSAEVTVCNCKKSKCLKLYCDCFAVMNYCSGNCNCMDCCNSTQREAERMDAIRSTKERNAFAFQTKINEKEQHSTGCHCKNSQCLKKYCECYTGGAFCGTNCKCASCLNFSGSADLAKARNSLRDGDGPGSSRKRKESPSSVALLGATPPGVQANKGGSQSVEKAINFSPEMHAATIVLNKSAAVAARQSAHPAVQIQSANRVMTAAQNVVTPLNSTGARNGCGLGASSGEHLQQTSKRAKQSPPEEVHTTPSATVAGRQLRSRKSTAEEDEFAAPVVAAPAFRSNFGGNCGSSSRNGGDVMAVDAANNKKRQVTFAPTVRNPIIYPFFGEHLPPTSKLIALKCLDYLEGKDIYAMSQVNSLWCSAAMDDALWE